MIGALPRKGQGRQLALPLAAMLCLTAPARAEEPAVPLSACSFQAMAPAAALAVRDGRTLLLEDGREARLAGLDVPSGYAGGAARLQELIAGRPLILKRLGLDADRYGRLLVYAFTVEAGAERSLQQALIAGGHARVSAQVGDRACASALLGEEAKARAAGAGLWREPAFRPQAADKPSELLADLGRFALVEGKVLSVRDNTGTIYMNFGRRWSESFTVTISKRNESTFKAAGLEPKSLAGRRIRVRGTLELRGGPVIEATRPEQIELAELK